MTDFRTETDSLGDVLVPRHARWGAQTQRAVDNFPISRPLPADFIHAVALIKQSAAAVNAALGLLDGVKAKAIDDAAQRILKGELADQFPVDVFQTGSGTSTNMNVNEVIAQLCAEAGVQVSANDDVNLGQSSNDTIPTAIHLATVQALESHLLPAIAALHGSIAGRAAELANQVKPGRTHLMDAMPITFSQQLHGWLSQLDHAAAGLRNAANGLLRIPQGGTAVGIVTRILPSIFVVSLVQRPAICFNHWTLFLPRRVRWTGPWRCPQRCGVWPWC